MNKYYKNDLDDVYVCEPDNENEPLVGKFLQEDGTYSEEREINDKSNIAVNTVLYGKEISQEEYESV